MTIFVNLLDLMAVSAAYFLLFVLVPFWLRGYKLSGERIMDKLVSSFLYSNVIIILCVYILSLSGIYNRYSLISLIILAASAYRLLFKRRQTSDFFRALSESLRDFAEGYYHPRVAIRNILGNLRISIKSLRCKIADPAGFSITLAIFGFAAYTRSYHSVVNLFFGSSDMYLHTEWTKCFMNNQPFSSGVYPLGFHAVAAALTDVFSINLITVMRMLGPVSGMLTVFSLYYILRRTARSLFTVNAVLALYVVTDLFPFWATERQFLALPQEFAAMFLYLTACFLYRYMKYKENQDLISFLAAFSLTLTIHFFVAVFAVFLCFFVFVSCLAYMKKEVILKLAAGLLCAVLVSAAPLAWGLIKGIGFNYSMNWAISVIAGDDGRGSGSGEKEPFASSLLEYYGKIYEIMIYRGFFRRTQKLSELNGNWFFPYLFSAAIGLLAPLYKMKERGRQWIYAGFSAYSLLLCVLYLLAYLGIFSIMEYSRIYVFFIYSIPLVLFIPLELLYTLTSGRGKTIRASYIALVFAASTAGILYFGLNKRVMPLGRVWYAQHDGAVASYYKIASEFPKNNWIIVSSFSEYSLCLYEGYHYQMVDFILELSSFNDETTITMPAENIFFYILKRPNRYLDTDIYNMNEIPVLPSFAEINANDNLIKKYGVGSGFDKLRLYYDFEANSVIQKYADAWAREYMKYFPNEMTVFYDDNNITVYKLKQDPYALNNLAIPYMGNDSD